MRALKHLFWSTLALLFLFEEWFWRVFGPVFHRLVAWLPLTALKRGTERILQALPPYVALLLFIIPAAIIFPFKLAGLWLFAHGRFFLGGLVFLAAKAVGFGSAAFLFDVCKPKLMQIGWFARLYEIMLRVSAWAHAQIAPFKARIRAVKARLFGDGRFMRHVALLRRRISR